MSEEPESEQRPYLTGRQRAFIDAWFGEAKFNATEAARIAGYDADRRTLRSIGSQNLAKLNIQAEIARRWAAHGMTAEEVISRLADQARGNIGEFLVYQAPVEGEGGGWRIDLERVQKDGHLVKSIQWTRHGPKVELYDSQSALQLIGKHLGLFADGVQHTGEIVVMHVIGGVDLNDV